jgi:hypothetical protein
MGEDNFVCIGKKPRTFSFSFSDDGTIVVYIDRKRYKYYCDNMARVDVLRRTHHKRPGRLFNEIKQISKLEE